MRNYFFVGAHFQLPLSKSILDRYGEANDFGVGEWWCGVQPMFGKIYCQCWMVPFVLLSTFWTHVIEIELHDHLIVLVFTISALREFIWMSVMPYGMLHILHITDLIIADIVFIVSSELMTVDWWLCIVRLIFVNYENLSYVPSTRHSAI